MVAIRSNQRDRDKPLSAAKVDQATKRKSVDRRHTLNTKPVEVLKKDSIDQYEYEDTLTKCIEI